MSDVVAHVRECHECTLGKPLPKPLAAMEGTAYSRIVGNFKNIFFHGGQNSRKRGMKARKEDEEGEALHRGLRVLKCYVILMRFFVIEGLWTSDGST